MITVLYTCKKCAGLTGDGILQTWRAFVRHRLLAESFDGWFNNAVCHAIEISHGFYQPHCKSATFDIYLSDEVRATRSFAPVALPPTTRLTAYNRLKLLGSTG